MKNVKVGLATKLVIYLSFSLILIFSIISVFNLRMYKRHMMMGVYQNAAQVSDIIKYSTNYSMMTNERQEIYRIIHTISREPGIEKIRIYNKEGKITFSTDQAEVNSMVDMRADACHVCHKDGSTPPSGDISILQRTRNYQDQQGRHVLGLISPIKTESSCVAAECHAHSADQKVLGVLDVMMQLDEIDAGLNEYEKSFHWYMFLTILVVCITSMLYVYFMVHRPIHKIVEGTKKVASGKLSFIIDIDSKDEIGSLAESFNKMTVDLKKFRNDLLSAKAYTDNIIHSMLNSLIVVNPDGYIKNVNKATCDLLGYSEEELINKPMSIVFAKGYFEELGFGYLSLHDFGGTGETIYQSKDGKKIRVLFSAACIRNDLDEIQGVVFIAQDITVQTEAMRAGHMSSLGELAAGVAHEINNPLNSIINFAQLLIDELQSDGELTDELLYRIINEGDRVSNIVRSLLSFARKSEEGKSMISLHEVIEETFSLLDIQILKDGINLEINIPETLPKIYGNAQQLMQVFINLTNNSRYALNQKFNGVNPHKKLVIYTELKEIDGEPVIDIIFYDEGTGIPDQIIDKVVNPFFTTKPAGEGTGLGLAISHGIVTDHDGRLIIESTEGEYTKVTVRLPLPAESDDSAETV